MLELFSFQKEVYMTFSDYRFACNDKRKVERNEKQINKNLYGRLQLKVLNNNHKIT